MTNLGLLALLCLVVFLISVAIFWLRTKRNAALSTTPTNYMEGAPVQIVPPASPLLEVGFSQALRTDDLVKRLDSYAKRRFAFELGLDPANVIIQAVSLKRDGIDIVFDFTKGGMRRWKSGEAFIPTRHGSDRLIPQLSEAKTGRFIEQATGRRIDPSRLAQVSSIVVSTAHVISGMDVVRRLENVDRKLDVLVKGREFDQKAELERIYQMSREKLSGCLTDANRQELVRSRGDLCKLRSVWRQEFQDTLDNAPDPREWKIVKPTTWKERWREQDTRNHVIAGAVKLRLIRLALAMDFCLALETRTIDRFVTTTTPDELALWEEPAEKLRAIANVMNSEHASDVRDLADAVCGYRDTLKAMSLKDTSPPLLKAEYEEERP